MAAAIGHQLFQVGGEGAHAALAQGLLGRREDGLKRAEDREHGKPEADDDGSGQTGEDKAAEEAAAAARVAAAVVPPTQTAH